MVVSSSRKTGRIATKYAPSRLLCCCLRVVRQVLDVLFQVVVIVMECNTGPVHAAAGNSTLLELMSWLKGVKTFDFWVFQCMASHLKITRVFICRLTEHYMSYKALNDI